MAESCAQLDDSTAMVSWDYIFSFHGLKSFVRTELRSGIDVSWLRERTGLAKSGEIASNGETDGVYFLDGPSRYHYRFYDDERGVLLPLGKAAERIFIEDLRKIDSRVVHFGTVFGSGRISLTRRENRRFRARVASALRFSNTALLQAARRCIKRLGGAGNYASLHVRVGDGAFLKAKAEIIQRATEKLHALMGGAAPFADRNATAAAAAAGAAGFTPAYFVSERATPGRDGAPHEAPQTPSADVPAEPDGAGGNRLDRDASRRALLQRCNAWSRRASSSGGGGDPGREGPGPGADDDDPAAPATMTVFLATDAADSRSDPAFRPLYSRFGPCVFDLEDLRAEFDRLFAAERSPSDGVTPTGKFLVPMLDAAVAASGRHFVGTSGSTFSGFVARMRDRYVA